MQAVIAHKVWNGNYLPWYEIFKYDGTYFTNPGELHIKGPARVLGVAGGKDIEASNVEVNKKNGSAAQ